jgi:tetraacyldisaccharide-1-P 4'-kinase
VANPFFQHHRGESDFTLKIIFSVENYTGKVLRPIAGRLREYFDLQAEFSVVIDLESEDQSNTI